MSAGRPDRPPSGGAAGVDALLLDFGGVLILRRRPPRPGSILAEIEAILSAAPDDETARRSVLERFPLAPERFDAVLAELVDAWEPHEPLWSLVPELRARYRVAVVCNGTGLTKPIFDRRYGLRSRFDAFLCSAVEGVRKPDPEIYLRACSRLGVEPARCLFTDDRIENVEGARRLGMHGLHWIDPEQGLRGLKSFLGVP